MRYGRVMHDKAILSVIVPMYNVEKYLSLCLDSLFRTEGIDDTEIILVDDGSTDKTCEIADKYSKEHGNITVLHKANEGPSAARNAGLAKASGEYVFFCDSDDEVDPALFGKILKLLKTFPSFSSKNAHLCYKKCRHGHHTATTLLFLPHQLPKSYPKCTLLNFKKI